MLTRSSVRFSIGVPVMAQLRSRCRLRTTWAVFDSRFLMRWASSSTTTSKRSRFVADAGGVAGQQLVVDQLERAVGDEPAGPAGVGVAADHLEGHVLRPGAQLARPVDDQRLGADDQGPADQAGVEQQPQGDDRLHRLAQPHLVGEQGGVARHQEGDALDLVRDTA